MEKEDNTKRKRTKREFIVKKFGAYSLFTYICLVNMTL